MKITPQMFRWLVGGSLLAGIGAVAVDLATVSLLPPELQDFLRNELEGGISRLEIMLVAIGMVILAAGVASYIGLFMIRKWGRLLFLLCNCLSLAFTAFTGPYVYTGLTLTCYAASSILIGLVIALSYFTPLFENHNTELERVRV